MSFSCPQFNLKEVNSALIKLLWNPDCDFEEIYCPPDFATGGVILNENEVKESLKNGQGKSCKIRAVINYDNVDNCLIVTQMPFSVYTNTICAELEDILNSDNNPGIERFNDLTGINPLIKIYLTKKASVNKVLKYLYSNTSLQSYFGINLTMLENGKYPKIFTWKECLQSYINHQIIVYERSFKFDLNKILERVHIIEGLKKAIVEIDEVVKTIKSSKTTSDAAQALQKLLNIDEVQAKAILDIKLSRLAHLELEKMEKEYQDLLSQKEKIENILNNPDLLKKEIEKDLSNVANKFGDARRTTILNLVDKNEIVEEKRLIVSITQANNLIIEETSTLITQRKRKAGEKIPLNKGEYIKDSITGKNTDLLMLFTNQGRVFKLELRELTLGTTNLYNLLALDSGENVTAIMNYNNAENKQYVFFITKKGQVKKSLLSEYKLKISKGIQGIKLKEDDEIISVVFCNDGDIIGILSAKSRFVCINSDSINITGRVTIGVKGIALNNDDEVVSSKIIPKITKSILFITKKGLIINISVNEIKTTERGGKGINIQKLSDEDIMCDFASVINEQNVIIISINSSLKLRIDDVKVQNRGGVGAATITKKNSEIIALNVE